MSYSETSTGNFVLYTLSNRLCRMELWNGWYLTGVRRDNKMKRDERGTFNSTEQDPTRLPRPSYLFHFTLDVLTHVRQQTTNRRRVINYWLFQVVLPPSWRSCYSGQQNNLMNIVYASTRFNSLPPTVDYKRHLKNVLQVSVIKSRWAAADRGCTHWAFILLQFLNLSSGKF